MGQYEEFDLDIKKEKANGNVTPASTSNLCWAASSAVVSSALQGCTGECVTANCESFQIACSQNACSDNTCTCYC